MKKKLLTFCLIFIFMFIININDVKGVYTCEYGIKESDDDTWESKVTLLVHDWNKISFSPLNSEIYEEFESSKGGEIAKDNSKSTVIYRYNILSPCLEGGIGDTLGNIVDGNCTDEPDNYYIYAELYPNPDSYEQANGKCPDIIKYWFHRKDGDGDAFSMSMYVDDLAKKNIVYDDAEKDKQKTDSDVADAYGFSETKGMLVSKEAKDKKLNEIMDVYDCYTYSVFYKSMSQAKVANNGSCDGSKDFKKNYKAIQELCTAYRSSENYVEGSGDDAEVPSCQKACTALEDDVAELCTIKDPGGYCGSLSADIVTYIFKLFGFARYIVPVILIILSIIDYIKAIASDSEDEMKKVSGRFAKRLLAAALIFIIPLIIDFILGMFNIPGLNADRPFCE